jgi:hypothetical protein
MDALMHNYPRTEDPYPLARDSWDRLRISILELAIEKYLIPSLLQEFRRELIRVGRESVVEEVSESARRYLLQILQMYHLLSVC